MFCCFDLVGEFCFVMSCCWDICSGLLWFVLIFLVLMFVVGCCVVNGCCRFCYYEVF